MTLNLYHSILIYRDNTLIFWNLMKSTAQKALLDINVEAIL